MPNRLPLGLPLTPFTSPALFAASYSPLEQLKTPDLSYYSSFFPNSAMLQAATYSPYNMMAAYARQAAAVAAATSQASVPVASPAAVQGTGV